MSVDAKPPASQEPLVHPGMRLALVPGIGPKSHRLLMERFGCAERVFRASYEELLAIPGVGPTLAQRIVQAAQQPIEQPVLAVCQAHGLRWVFRDEPDYPPLLAQLDDAPALLFYRGQLRPEHRRAVAMVGTRYPTGYGLRQADRLARQLVQAGFTIISGLARGIDAAAHRAALAAGGSTWAVLGGGLLQMYPAEHRRLADQIASSGAVLSELPPEHPPRSGNFPQRNRIISGLSLGVVVVEAGIRSGALITAQHALEQGREVFAVPGSIENPVSRGCHQLIRDGAKLVESAQDIIDELASLLQLVEPPDSSSSFAAAGGAATDRGALPASVQLSPAEQRLWHAIDPTGSLVDDAIQRSGLSAHEALVALAQLEVKQLVRRIGGARVTRAAPATGRAK
ncbi:MAG: DNA polymerase III [Pirellulaceae bacterium]|nr:MAG: DNA polymerase III [Pirellulaceae bacterium]